MPKKSSKKFFLDKYMIPGLCSCHKIY